MKNLYLSTADFYDIDNYNLWYHDLDFYLEYARHQGGAILEVACGTGRVTIPLAQAGFEVHGIDLSLPMLTIFRRKLDSLDTETARRIALEHADMADFELGRTFDLIIVPFRAFQALTTDERARSALLCMKRHLSERGLLIIDLFKPSWRMDRSWETDEERVDWVKNIPETGETIVRTEISRRIDTVSQIIYPEIIYYVEGPAGDRRKIVEPLALRYYYEYQMQVHLACAGLAVVDTFGSYDRRGTDAGSELIFVARRLARGVEQDGKGSTAGI